MRIDNLEIAAPPVGPHHKLEPGCVAAVCCVSPSPDHGGRNALKDTWPGAVRCAPLSVAVSLLLCTGVHVKSRVDDARQAASKDGTNRTASCSQHWES